MENFNVLTIVFNILWVLFGFIMIYFKTKTNIVDLALDKIKDAEIMYKDTMKAGSQKQAYVVDFIYSVLPAPMRLIFGKEVIQSLVQATFDSMQAYAYT